MLCLDHLHSSISIVLTRQAALVLSVRLGEVSPYKQIASKVFLFHYTGTNREAKCECMAANTLIWWKY